MCKRAKEQHRCARMQVCFYAICFYVCEEEHRLACALHVSLSVTVCVCVYVCRPGAELGSQLCQQLTKASLVFIVGGVDL